jgi:hypothetical protein
MTMEVEVRITEILSRVIKIDTFSKDDAVNQVKRMYKNEDIVLDYTDFIGYPHIEEKEDNFLSRKDFLISKVIDYLIKDEQKHYEESDCPKDHMYLTLLELKEYID